MARIITNEELQNYIVNGSGRGASETTKHRESVLTMLREAPKGSAVLLDSEDLSFEKQKDGTPVTSLKDVVRNYKSILRKDAWKDSGIDVAIATAPDGTDVVRLVSTK
jgi:hypothetical protein